MLDRGHDLDIYALGPQTLTKMHADVLKYKLLERTYYFKPPANKFWRLVKAIGLLIAYLPQKPIILVRSLNFFKYGKMAGSLKLLYLAAAFVDKKNYDIIHCHFGANGFSGLLLRRIGAIQGKVIVSFHGHDATRYPNQHVQGFYETLFKEADLFTVNSNFIGQKVSKLGCDQRKIVKLPESLKVAEFIYRERCLPKGNQIQILTVARLVEKKGLEYSIKAVAKVLEKYPNIKYRIAGDGPLRPSLQTLIERLGLEGNIELLGWQSQDEIQQLYADTHIFILASVTANDGDQEGQGLVLQEAQAMGLPVISTLHNGIPEGVLDGQSAFLVPEKDAEALAERLTYLIEHPEIWSAMGQAGREFVEKRFDVDKLNDQLVEIYQQLLSGKLP